jgi:membrane protein
MTATNIAYGEREKRSFLKQTLISLVLTVGAVTGFLVMLLLGIALPTALNLFGTRPAMQIAADIVQWLVLWLFATVGLAFVYRYAPAREPARWHWVSWGSAIATTLWLGASALFAIYVKAFANYGKTYGALGGVIALLMWFYISSVIVVLGAEINAEMERQTERDTTEGQEAPLGERGAYAADTVGPPPGSLTGLLIQAGSLGKVAILDTVNSGAALATQPTGIGARCAIQLGRFPTQVALAMVKPACPNSSSAS